MQHSTYVWAFSSYDWHTVLEGLRDNQSNWSLGFLKLNTFITKSYTTLTYLKLLWISCCIAAFSLGMSLEIKRIDTHWTCMFTGEMIRISFTTAELGTQYITDSVSIYICNGYFAETLYLFTCNVLFTLLQQNIVSYILFPICRRIELLLSPWGNCPKQMFEGKKEVFFIIICAHEACCNKP